MAHVEFVGHNLIGVLAVGLAEGFVEHDAVENGAAAVDAVDDQESEPGDVVGFHNEAADQEEEDESDADAANIAGEAFCFVLRAEVEPAEYEDAQDGHDNQAFADEFTHLIQQEERQKDCQAVPSRNAIDTIHEIIDVRGANAHNQPKQHHPPHVPMQHPNLLEHHKHCSELGYQAHAIGQRMDVIDKTHPCSQRHSGQQPRVNVMPDRQCVMPGLTGHLNALPYRPHPKANQEDNAAAANYHFSVGAAIIGFVDYIMIICNYKVYPLKNNE